jgi:hypothetical protein
MDDLEKVIGRRMDAMSHEEIIQQFKRIFGREMTASEHKTFFLPRLVDSTPEKE